MFEIAHCALLIAPLSPSGTALPPASEARDAPRSTLRWQACLSLMSNANTASIFAISAAPLGSTNVREKVWWFVTAEYGLAEIGTGGSFWVTVQAPSLIQPVVVPAPFHA